MGRLMKRLALVAGAAALASSTTPAAIVPMTGRPDPRRSLPKPPTSQSWRTAAGSTPRASAGRSDSSRRPAGLKAASSTLS